MLRVAAAVALLAVRGVATSPDLPLLSSAGLCSAGAGNCGEPADGAVGLLQRGAAPLRLAPAGGGGGGGGTTTCNLGPFAQDQSAASEQPPGVSDPIYRCTFQKRLGRGIKISICGQEVVCGGPGPLWWRSAVQSPSVKFTEAEPGALYTLLLLNPDDVIPVQPILHLLLGNVEGTKLRSGHLDGAEAAVSYMMPSGFFNNLVPISFSYVYMVYKQHGPVNVAAWRAQFGDNRQSFPLKEFVQNSSLELAGTNYFRTAGDGEVLLGYLKEWLPCR